ncbi:MAG: hypothetical protein ABI129_01825 [Rhodanobacter sp.]
MQPIETCTPRIQVNRDALVPNPVNDKPHSSTQQTQMLSNTLDRHVNVRLAVADNGTNALTANNPLDT